MSIRNYFNQKHMKTPFEKVILLCTLILFLSCEKNENVPQNIYLESSLPAEYLRTNFPDVEFFDNENPPYYFITSRDKDILFNIIGIKKDHLWFCTAKTDSIHWANAKKSGNVDDWKDTFEWEDTDVIKKTDSTYLGYGVYDLFQITKLGFYKVLNNTNGLVALVYIFRNRNENVYDSYGTPYFIFIFNNKVKKTPGIISPNGMSNWYNNSVVIDGCCYSEYGDTLYTSPYLKGVESDLSNNLTSYEDAILLYGNCVSKFNYKKKENIWRIEKTRVILKKDLDLNM